MLTNQENSYRQKQDFFELKDKETNSNVPLRSTDGYFDNLTHPFKPQLQWTSKIQACERNVKIQYFFVPHISL